MPDAKISALASGNPPQAGDLVVIARGGSNFKLTYAQLFPTGIFTPTVISSGGGTPTYTTQSGTYTVVGDRILYSIRVVLATAGTLAAGNVSVGGLPFTSNATAGNVHAAPVTIFGAAATAITQVTGTILNNDTAISIFKYAAGALTNLTVADTAGTTGFNISGQYQT